MGLIRRVHGGRRNDDNPERTAAFQKLATDQRGEPEMAMSRLQMAQIAQAYGWLTEHIGDLTNRMSDCWEGLRGWGAGAIDEKVRKTLRELRVYREPGAGLKMRWTPFGGDLPDGVMQQVRSNVRYVLENPRDWNKKAPRTVEEAVAKLRVLAERYAQEHSKLVVWNDLQWHAREAAVALGRFEFQAVLDHLEVLEAALDAGDEAWFERAGTYTGTPCERSA